MADIVGSRDVNQGLAGITPCKGFRALVGCQFRSAAHHHLCLSKIKAGHIGGAARRELGGKESARPVRRYARTAHLLQGEMCAGAIIIFHVRQQQVAEVTFAGHDNVVEAFPSDRRSVVRHTRFAMETVETSADRECPLIESVG